MQRKPLLASSSVLLAVLASTAAAHADAASDSPLSATPRNDVQVQPTNPFARVNPPDDPTGGAYTTPTLLFVPAGAVPTWNVRVITSVDMQGPTPTDKFATGSCGGNACVGVQPGVGGEVGLPAGFTLGAGTRWVGGDTVDYNGGISPYFQLRYHIAGADNGRGFQLGSSVTYKFVGFGSNQGVAGQDPGEMEWAMSAQYRQQLFEVGLQGVFGKDFATTSADGEVHAYAVYRVVPQLALGGAGQLRMPVVAPPSTPPDVISGALASLTLGRWQLAALAGESTIGLATANGKIVVGALGELFGTARF